jgi:hypothetical protein
LKDAYNRLSEVDVTQDNYQDEPPRGDEITEYDRTHIVMYSRLLDAESDGAGWEEAVRVIFGLDPARDPDRAKRIHTAHLERARWMTENYRNFIRANSP